jgi:hypothetical protein
MSNGAEKDGQVEFYITKYIKPPNKTADTGMWENRGNKKRSAFALEAVLVACGAVPVAELEGNAGPPIGIVDWALGFTAGAVGRAWLGSMPGRLISVTLSPLKSHCTIRSSFS